MPGPDLTTPPVRFWGWSENKREEDLDLAELRQRVAEGKPLHPESSQPPWIQDVAYRNSVWSQLKFRECPPRRASSLLDSPCFQRRSRCETSRAVLQRNLLTVSTGSTLSTTNIMVRTLPNMASRNGSWPDRCSYFNCKFAASNHSLVSFGIDPCRTYNLVSTILDT
jgi:hypothetical protein